MNRQEVLSDAILREPHPKYGKLSYGRFSLIQKLTASLPEDATVESNSVAWFVCTRPKNDPSLQAALASEKPVESIMEIVGEEMHATEAGPFLAWFNAELGATDAAATKEKEQTGPGKSEDKQLATHTS